MLVSSLIKHLDHKNVMKQQSLQLSMVNVASCLVLHSKQQASGAMTAVIADLIKHLRKCLQNAAESDVSADEMELNSELQLALENCISELSNKVSWTGSCSFEFLVVSIRSFPQVLLVSSCVLYVIIHQILKKIQRSNMASSLIVHQDIGFACIKK